MTDKELKDTCKALFVAVKAAVDEWNPYGLLPGAPDDEFDTESTMIAASIKKCRSDREIAGIVADVFSKQFEPQYFTIDTCLNVAQKIRQNIEKISFDAR